MTERCAITSLILIALLFTCPALPQSKSPPHEPFPYDQVIFAETAFFDFGPPFNYHSLYKLTASGSGTDVEEVAITPPGFTCAMPATTKVSHGYLQQNLAELLNYLDPCDISEKELRREAKRCKHCLVFSGVHVSAQFQCNGKPRIIRYEVLDRDIYSSSAKTPLGTSRTMNLLGVIHNTLGSGAAKQPIFPTGSSKNEIPVEDQTLKEIKYGTYDRLFSTAISQIYLDSLKQPSLPIVSIVRSSPSAPVAPVLPAYPPIARAAHISGDVSLNLKISDDGSVSEVEWQSGPELLKTVSVDAAKLWVFPARASTQTQSVTMNFNTNCPVTADTSVSKIR